MFLTDLCIFTLDVRGGTRSSSHRSATIKAIYIVFFHEKSAQHRYGTHRTGPGECDWVKS